MNDTNPTQMTIPTKIQWNIKTGMIILNQRGMMETFTIKERPQIVEVIAKMDQTKANGDWLTFEKEF